jgi:putative tryptophan/tyrosine transport system substrate-binding protein
MQRREFIAGMAATAAVDLASAVHAQSNSSAIPKRIAIVDPAAEPEEVTINGIPSFKAYLTELNRLGYVEGQNLVVERYLALGRPERQAENAQAVVASHPDLIVAIGGPVVRQLKPLTTIPIIAISGDPVAGKIVTNLARPDGNITGVSVDVGMGLYAKRLELLRETTRKLTTVPVLYSASALPFWEMALKAPLQQAGARIGVSLSVAVPAETNRESYERAFDSITADGADGLMVGDTSEMMRFRELIVELAARHRLPAIYSYREFVEAGGLMSYGVELRKVFRRMADMSVDVMRGAKPADIPYYQQTKFELVLNRRTAAPLGVEFPTTLLAAADEVIE